MKRILAQAAKEWKQFRRDRLTLALSLALPIVMMLLFGSSRLHFPLVPCFCWYAAAWLAAADVTATEPRPQRAAPLANAWS